MLPVAAAQFIRAVSRGRFADAFAPFVHYVVFLILGGALVILRPPRPGSLGTGLDPGRGRRSDGAALPGSSS